MKSCNKCKKHKELNCFANDKSKKDGKHTICKLCRKTTDAGLYVKNRDERKISSKVYYSQSKAVYRRRELRTRYNLTEEDYNKLLAFQENRCASCRTLEPSLSTRFTVWQVDHDHTCCPGSKSCGKCIRGLLCAACNRAAGLLKDDPERVRQLEDYLRNPPTKRFPIL